MYVYLHTHTHIRIFSESGICHFNAIPLNTNRWRQILLELPFETSSGRVFFNELFKKL